MRRTTQILLADRVMGGKLKERLTEWRVEGQSHEEIARRLSADHGITLSSETIRRWSKQLGVS